MRKFFGKRDLCRVSINNKKCSLYTRRMKTLKTNDLDILHKSLNLNTNSLMLFLGSFCIYSLIINLRLVVSGLASALFFYNNLKLMEEGQHIELNYKEIDSLER